MSQIDPLSRLAVLNGTDKFGYHDYTPNYHRLLHHLRDKPIRLLEIGVGGYGDEDRGGESLAVWRDYFPNAKIIVGIDIQRKTMDLGPRVEILQGSQVDPEFLEQVQKDHGPFDVIIDDGSHRNEHVIESFELLYPQLVEGGIYIAEDVQTSFHPRFGGSVELVQPNSVGYFTGLTADLSQVESGKIEKMDRFHNIFAIQKARSNASPDDVSLWFRDDRVRIILSNPKSVVGSFSGATIPATILADLKLLSGVPVKIENPKSGKAPLEKMDLVVANASQVSSESTLQYLFELCHPHGFVVILADKPGAIRQNTKYRDLFVQIDHIEINVHFPDAPIAPYAAEIYAMSAYHDGIIAELGENTYPSNFAWRADHTRTDAVLAAMEEILQSDEATENGLLQYADILHRHRSPESAMVILRRLEKIDCRERRYFQMIGLNLQKSGDWENAAVIYGMALDKFAHDPQFTVNLAACYRRLSRQIEAEALLRQTLAENSRARPVVVMLSKILVHRGDLDEAVSLAEQSINLFPKVLRLPRLIDLVQLALRADRPSVAEKALARAEELGPDDPDVHAARLAFNQHVSSS